MIVTLLYHRAFECRYGNKISDLENHFLYLKKKFEIVHPLDPIKKRRTSVCITFDDATYDFYKYVYPLVQKHKIKVVLSVPTGLIAASESTPPDVRIRELKRFPDHSTNSSCYCSFAEISEMSSSGLVEIASHGVTHSNLTLDGVDIEYEIKHSKETLEAALHKKIECFVYPYGKYNKTAHQIVKKYYKIGMRIGNGNNRSWDSSLHYRFNADGVKKISTLFKPRKQILGTLKSLKSIFY